MTWKELPLREAGVVLIDCDHRTPKAQPDGFPYVAIPQLSGGRIKLDGARRISESDFLEWTKRLRPEANDVIVVRRCNSGDSAFVSGEFQCAIGQNLVVLRSDGELVVPEYLRWMVRGAEWWREVRRYVNVGAVFDSLRCGDIPEFMLPVPPLEDQRRIVGVLGALDDRIELLRETNSTLEAIAQALFKSWFVDYDPVRAKSEGRMPEGMDAATAELFPDSFEDSPIGPIPKGWRLGTLEGLMALHRGTINPAKHPAVEFQHFSLPAFDASGLPSNQVGSTIKSNKTTVPPDATLISKLNPRIPRVWMPTTISSNAVCSTEFLPFLPSSGSNREFVYCCLQSEKLLDSLKQAASGTSGSHQRVRPEAVLSHPFPLPETSLITEFGRVSGALLARLRTDRTLIVTLESLRDALLPRLVSGRLRIEEAEDEMSGALESSEA